MGLPGSLCGPHICDSNPPTHDVQVALGGPRRCHPSLPWHVNRQDDEKASGQEPSRRNLEEPRPDTHLRASCMTPRSPQLPPHPFVSFCRCASLALPCSPGPCCLSAWPLLSASLALALPVWLLPCLPGPCLAHQAPAVCQPGLCPACLAPAVCQPGPCPACLASDLPAWTLPCPPGPCCPPAWPLPCPPGPCPVGLAPALPTWPLLPVSLALPCLPGPCCLPSWPLPCPPGPCCLSAWPLPCPPGPRCLSAWPLPCLPGPCCLPAWPLPCLSGFCPACLALALLTRTLPCPPGPCPAHLAPAVCQPGPCLARQAPAACQGPSGALTAGGHGSLHSRENRGYGSP